MLITYSARSEKELLVWDLCCVPKKGSTKLTVTSQNLNRFSKFFVGFIGNFLLFPAVKEF